MAIILLEKIHKSKDGAPFLKKISQGPQFAFRRLCAHALIMTLRILVILGFKHEALDNLIDFFHPFLIHEYLKKIT
jgi:hypothetical protein